MSDSLLTGDFWVFYGDGNAAQILESKEYIKKNGVKHHKFLLLPSTRIQEQYDITDKQDPMSGAVVMEYPWTEVIFLERSVNRTRCWVLTDFMGGPTPASRQHDDFKTALIDSDKLLRSATAAKNRILEELEKERTQQAQSMRKMVAIVNEARRATARTDGEEDEGDDYSG